MRREMLRCAQHDEKGFGLNVILSEAKDLCVA